MITAQQLLYKAANNPDIKNIVDCDYKCCMCANGIIQGVPRKDAIKKTFTNLDLLKKPNAKFVCIPCAFAINEACPPELMGRVDKDKPQKIRCYSHAVVNGLWKSFSKAQRVEMREIVCNPPSGTWFLCLSESGQKHLIFRTPVNNSQDNYLLQFEEYPVLVTRKQVASDLGIADRVYSAQGLDKVKGDIKESLFSPWSTDQFLEEYKYLKKYEHSPYLRMLIFLAEKKENPYG